MMTAREMRREVLEGEDSWWSFIGPPAVVARPAGESPVLLFRQAVHKARRRLVPCPSECCMTDGVSPEVEET